MLLNQMTDLVEKKMIFPWMKQNLDLSFLSQKEMYGHEIGIKQNNID